MSCFAYFYEFGVTTMCLSLAVVLADLVEVSVGFM